MTKPLLITAISGVLLAAGCGPANSPQHSNAAQNGNSVPVDHSKMDHSKMDHGTMDHSKMESSPNAAAADFDLQFLDTMIAHHEGAVEMARLIPTRAAHEELKKMGDNVISSQQKEIDQMKAWREKWFAGKPPAINMDMPGMRDSMSGMDMTRLAGLNGNAFDIEFVKQMGVHHEGALVMSQDAIKRTAHPEISKLAEQIIKDQTTEIEQMKGWQREWSK